MQEIRYLQFMSKNELAKKLNISRETLRIKMKNIKGLQTGKRQLLYPYEVRMIFEAFGVGN